MSDQRNYIIVNKFGDQTGYVKGHANAIAAAQREADATQSARYVSLDCVEDVETQEVLPNV